MYRLYFLLTLLIVLYIIPNIYEPFNVWDYEFPLSNIVYKDKCPIQGTIEQIDNPSMDSCYRGYYIPYIFNVGTYVSEVQSQM